MSINAQGLGQNFFVNNQFGNQGPQRIIRQDQQDGGPRVLLRGPEGGGFPGQDQGFPGQGGPQLGFNNFDNRQGIGLQGLNFEGQGQDGRRVLFRGPEGSNGFPGADGQDGRRVLFRGPEGGNGFPGQDGQDGRRILFRGPEGSGFPGGLDAQGGFGQGQGPRIVRMDPAQMFSRMDADGNGSLTQAELDNRPAPPGMPEATDEMKTAEWTRLDADQDGTVTQEEFVQAGPPPRPQLGFNNDNSNAFFNSFQNAGSNGNIDLNSLYSLFSNLQTQ